MAKDKMAACMSEWTSKHPHGRAKKPLSKKEAHRQAVAACLQKTNEGITFKGFLAEADSLDVREYIRSLPLYQELLKDPQTKPEAMKLAQSFVREFGNAGADPQVQSYVADEFDDLYRRSASGQMGTNVGDWKGEEDYQRKQQEEKDLESAIDKWERTTGMNAETGAEVQRDRRGRVRHGARVGMDFRPEIKSARAARDLKAQGTNDETVTRRAAARPAGENAYAGGVSKAKLAAKIVADGLQQGLAPREIKKHLRDELDMTAAGANTYYYKYKKIALNNQ